MKMLVRLILVVSLSMTAAPMAAPPRGTAPGPERELAKPNYDLASRWTSAKVSKMVFSTAVTPHWLEFSDRFWYSYETPSGMKWWIVDPVRKTKAPLWDNAKLAAQLTRSLRTPYDAQHLPIENLKFIKNDALIQFSVDLPKESKVESATGEELVGDTQRDQQDQQEGQRGRGGRGGQQQNVQQGGRGGRGGTGGPAANEKRWWFEYDIASGTLTLNDKYEPEKPKPTWVTMSPDKQTVLFARGFNLFMMDAKNYALAEKKADDPAIVETQMTTDGEKDYSYAGGGQGGGQQDDQQQDNQGTGQGGQGAAARALSEQDKNFGPSG